jgi:hypothetical protein
MNFEASLASQFGLFGVKADDSRASANVASRWGHASLSVCADTDVTGQGGAEDPPVVAVIDDDERVRQSTVWLLESAGYRVLSYISGDVSWRQKFRNTRWPARHAYAGPQRPGVLRARRGKMPLRCSC